MKLLDLPVQHYFITGTDTEVGKTYVTGKVIESFQQRGENPYYWKPIASGAIFEEEQYISEDAKWIKSSTQVHQELNQMTGELYKAPASPNIAAEEEGKTIDPEELIKRSKAFLAHHKNTIMEGIGGVLVPLTQGFTVADLIAKLELPTIIVSRPNLGTINHSLLTAEALKRRNIPLVGWIFNQPTATPLTPFEIKGMEVVSQETQLPILANYSYENPRRGEDPHE